MQKVKGSNQKILFFIAAYVSLTLLAGSIALASEIDRDEGQARENKIPASDLHLTSLQAAAYVQKHAGDCLFLDIRDPGEIFTIGMPLLADGNAPFRFINFQKWNEKKKTFAMEENPDFVKTVDFFLKKKGLSRSAPIIIICSSGRRAPKAANLLSEAGYKNVYAVTDGYNGWRQSKLPWSRKLEKDKMFTLISGKTKK